MRISDWSSDVCSSDLERTGPPHRDKTDSLSPERRNQAPGSIRHWCGALLAAPGSGSRSSSGEPAGSSEDRGASQDPSSSPAGSDRSEEHTSELQSLMRISYAVFCLNKKKTQDKNTIKVEIQKTK